MKKGMVSIIISCFNYGKYIEDALKSASETVYENKEIIVIDDRSTDDSLKIINELKRKYDFKLIVNSENIGAARSRNKAVFSSSGEFIFICDADDWFHKDFISEAVKIAEKDEKISPVYCDVIEKGESTAFDIKPEWSLEKLKTGPFIHAASLTRRTAWDKCGGMDANLQAWIDYELFLNMGLNGFIGVRLPKFYAYYRRRPTDPSTITYYAKDNIRDLRHYIRKKHGYE